MPYKLASLLLSLYPAMALAFFCPTNFNQIETGASMDDVIQQCGKPDSQSTKEQAAEGPQEWSYYIPQNVASPNPLSQSDLSQTQGTLKTQIVFDAQGKAININVNGIGVGATTVCGSTLQLGSTRDEVKAACGQPSFVNKQNNNTAGQEQQNTKITTFIYNSNPPMKLIFSNGKLTEKQ